MGRRRGVAQVALRDGSRRWQSPPSEGQSYLAVALADGALYASNPGHIDAFTATDGQLRWQAEAGYRSFDALTAG
jgi:hypothetical protein